MSCDCLYRLPTWLPNKAHFSLDTCPTSLPPAFPLLEGKQLTAGALKRAKSLGGLVQTQWLPGPTPWVSSPSRSGVKLYFWQTTFLKSSRECWCCWSGDHNIRTADLHIGQRNRTHSQDTANLSKKACKGGRKQFYLKVKFRHMYMCIIGCWMSTSTGDYLDFSVNAIKNLSRHNLLSGQILL